MCTYNVYNGHYTVIFQYTLFYPTLKISGTSSEIITMQANIVHRANDIYSVHLGWKGGRTTLKLRVVYIKVV